jgi:hypothetical protein
VPLQIELGLTGFSFISYQNAHTKKGQILHFPIENRRKSGGNRPAACRGAFAAATTRHLSEKI